MIKISKPPAPAVLQGRGQAKQAEHCADYDLAPRDYDTGAKTFRFNAALYGAESVKQALIAAQHGKCCFCEKKTGAEEGDIEHFRPKASVCQGKGFPRERPGYYWLAYDWDNLLWACSTCNQRFKRNLFPLGRRAKRARNHRGDMAGEEPLLLNPADDDPAPYIGFRREVSYAIRGSKRAKATIQVLGLNRESLIEARRSHLDNLGYLRRILDQEARLAGSAEGRRILKEAQVYLQDAQLDSAVFAAMTREALGRNRPSTVR